MLLDVKGVRTLKLVVTDSRCQVVHLMGKTCLRTPRQLIFDNPQEFEEMRPLSNSDGTWMRIYYRETQQTGGGFLSALSAIGDGLFRRAQKLGVEEIDF